VTGAPWRVVAVLIGEPRVHPCPDFKRLFGRRAYFVDLSIVILDWSTILDVGT
jgi:hypothetical protein